MGKKDYWQKTFFRNKLMITFGKGKKYGLFGGFHVWQSFDWWHLAIGQTFLFWFITIEYRWRVFGCGYNRFDKNDIYI